MTDAVQPRRTPLPLPSQWPVAIGALLATSYGVGFLAGYGWQFGVLFVIGGLLGMSLYQAEFGFTAAYRNAMVRRDVAGVRAQVLMVVLAVLIFAPTLAGGVSASGIRAVGALAPTGWEVAVGSFVFGIGMQLASGCGSGTLFTVGGGSTRMVVTLIFFCIGAFLATLAWDWDALVWLRARSTPVSLGGTFGWGVATVGQVALLGAIWLGLGRWGRGRDQKPIWTGLTWRRLLSGPWPLLFSGILMALLNWTILELTGHAWSITWGFTLWAAEAAQLLGWEPPRHPVRPHLDHQCRHHPRRPDRRRVRRALRADPEDPGEEPARRRDRRPAARHRRAHGLWLQHRRLLLGCRVGQPARLGLDPVRGARQLGRRATAPGVRAGEVAVKV
jgi:uncharacterized membrane protein YedE/YeeE